jgi:hypothetical protein
MASIKINITTYELVEIIGHLKETKADKSLINKLVKEMKEALPITISEAIDFAFDDINRLKKQLNDKIPFEFLYELHPNASARVMDEIRGISEKKLNEMHLIIKRDLVCNLLTFNIIYEDDIINYLNKNYKKKYDRAFLNYISDMICQDKSKFSDSHLICKDYDSESDSDTESCSSTEIESNSSESTDYHNT